MALLLPLPGCTPASLTLLHEGFYLSCLVKVTCIITITDLKRSHISLVFFRLSFKIFAMRLGGMLTQALKVSPGPICLSLILIVQVSPLSWLPFHQVKEVRNVHDEVKSMNLAWPTSISTTVDLQFLCVGAGQEVSKLVLPCNTEQI